VRRVYQAPALFSQLADPDTIVCRCENVTLATVAATAREVHSSGALKRLTRAGMGQCQGRFCGFMVTHLVAETTGVPADAQSGFAPQPPLRPVQVSALAAPGRPAKPEPR
jgi:NAD(P)H-nitrite reductase large subunit